MGRGRSRKDWESAHACSRDGGGDGGREEGSERTASDTAKTLRHGGGVGIKEGVHTGDDGE